MKLIFIRHLPTINNIHNVFLGRLDLECDKNYIKKNKLAIEKYHSDLASQEIDIIYSSPLKRAKNTINLLFPEYGYIVDDRLIERDLGDWSNVSKNCIKDKDPEAFYDNGALNFLYTPTNGESFESMIFRVASFLKTIYEEHHDKTIAIVTHNGVITVAKCIINFNFKSTKDYEFQHYLEPYIIEINGFEMSKIKEILESEKFKRS